jgi:hypothetical protein
MPEFHEGSNFFYSLYICKYPRDRTTCSAKSAEQFVRLNRQSIVDTWSVVIWCKRRLGCTAAGIAADGNEAAAKRPKRRWNQMAGGRDSARKAGAPPTFLLESPTGYAAPPATINVVARNYM